MVDVDGGESLDPGFAEPETFVSINGDCLPPAGGDIQQQQRRKENAEKAVQLTQPTVHKWMLKLSVKRGHKVSVAVVFQSRNTHIGSDVALGHL